MYAWLVIQGSLLLAPECGCFWQYLCSNCDYCCYMHLTRFLWTHILLLSTKLERILIQLTGMSVVASNILLWTLYLTHCLTLTVFSHALLYCSCVCRISQELLQNVLPQQQVHYVVPTATRGSTNGHNGGSGAIGQPETRHPATVSTPLPSAATSLASSSATAADTNIPANGETPEPVYQQVILKKKPTVTVQPELHYAELDICKQGLVNLYNLVFIERAQ